MTEQDLLIANNLREIVMRRQIAFKVLSNAIEVSTSTISRYLNGQQAIPLLKLELICEYLKICIDDLCSCEPETVDIYLVGNGFELAHGLSLTTKDFVDFLQTKILVAIKNRVTLRPHFFESHSVLLLLKQECIGKKETKIDNLQFKTEFVKQFINSYCCTNTIINWSEIEQLYFKHLHLLYRRENGQMLLDDLNEAMTILTKLLTEFTHNSEHQTVELMTQYQKIFNLNRSYHNKYFLNFTYSSLLSRYLEPHFNDKSLLLKHMFNLHGQVNQNDIFFGYGGETIKAALEVNQSYLKGIKNFFKSNYYILNSQYVSILDLISTQKYNLHILGFSCGVSDSMLLKTILNHNNLNRVQLYYYPDQNQFLEVFHNINRIVGNPSFSLKKIIPYSKSILMEQK